MAIMRVHKSNNYSIVSNQLLDNTILSADATLLLLRMLRKPDDWQFSVQKLAEEYGWSKNKVSRCFAELKALHFLEIIQKKLSKRFTYTYHVYEIPYDCYLDDESRIRYRDTHQEFIMNHYTTSLKTDRVSHACAILGKYFSRHGGFLGTAQELIDDLPEEVQGEFTAATMGKTLRSIEAALEKNYDLVVEYKKTKHARLISVHYTDEESPFGMAEILGDSTDPQNEGTVPSPQNQRVTAPIPKIGIPEMGIIINTELNNNKHKKVSDGFMRESDVTTDSDWTSDFAQDLVWTEDAVDAVTSFTADSCQSAYVFDLDTALQDDMDSDVADDGLAVDSSLDSESNDSALDLMDEEDLSDVSSVFGSRAVVQHSDRGTSYPDVLCDEDLFAELYEDFETECSNACMNPYGEYSERDFKEMEAFYEQSMAEVKPENGVSDGFEEEDDIDWFIDRLPILRDTKHNPFLYLTEEDVQQMLEESRKQKEQRKTQEDLCFTEDNGLQEDALFSEDAKDILFTHPDCAETKSDGNETNSLEKQKEPDFSKSNGMQEEKEQVSKIQEQMSKKEVLRSVDWVTQEDVSRGTVYPSDAKPKESVDPWETVKKSHSEKVSGKKTCSSFSDLLFVCESFPSFRTKEVGDRSLPLAVLQIQRNRGLPK
ncbi:hypothetical protein PND93_10130 [Faecalicoccus pleomorphus]|uniref:hypothetical protein n=1 Tax=Faecalicoccus pleomorphus TaxID=1323 RepID=UPI00232DBCE5|nr:hypothetical protein [Faecalicoccus pleomorphus]MDB7985664.1 hypothetical protein [Faecalicoccus pleomorphus]MDB7991951.1 hypothetical protein [Faecalicoccus pleomorphus]